MDSIFHFLMNVIGLMLAFSSAVLIFGIVFLVLLLPQAIVFLLCMFVGLCTEYEHSKLRIRLGWSRPHWNWKAFIAFPIVQLGSFIIFIVFFSLEGWYITTNLLPRNEVPSDAIMILIASAMSMIPVMMWSGWAYPRVDAKISFAWACIVGGILQVVTTIGSVAIMIWLLIQKSQG